jgi:hypothetical protein
LDCSLEEEVFEVKVLETLSSMQHGRIHVLDGFTMEFFQIFYEIIKQDNLLVVRESQRSDKILVSLKCTFIYIIPKNKYGSSFGNFRPISCCNVIYKFMTKIIDRRLREVLSKVIADEHLCLL